MCQNFDFETDSPTSSPKPSNLRNDSPPERGCESNEPAERSPFIPYSPTDARVSPCSAIAKILGRYKSNPSSFIPRGESQRKSTLEVMENLDLDDNSSGTDSTSSSSGDISTARDSRGVNSADEDRIRTLSFHGIHAVPCPTSLPIVLGCLNSRYARIIMDEMGWDCTVRDLEIDEMIATDGKPHDIVLRYASAGIESLQEGVFSPSSLIVSCARAVDFQNTTKLKPASPEMVCSFLSSYTDSVVHVVTGVLVKNMENGNSAMDVCVADVLFGKWYSEMVLDCVSKRSGVMEAPGALDFEDKDIQDHTDYIDGPMGSTLGVPIEIVCKLIREVI